MTITFRAPSTYIDPPQPAWETSKWIMGDPYLLNKALHQQELLHQLITGSHWILTQVNLSSKITRSNFKKLKSFILNSRKSWICWSSSKQTTKCYWHNNLIQLDHIQTCQGSLISSYLTTPIRCLIMLIQAPIPIASKVSRLGLRSLFSQELFLRPWEVISLLSTTFLLEGQQEATLLLRLAAINQRTPWLHKHRYSLFPRKVSHLSETRVARRLQNPRAKWQ